jgi:hypothetical protein
MARRIAADFYEADERIAFQLFAPAVRDGKHDDDEAVQCALAAIMETQALDAALVDSLSPSAETSAEAAVQAGRDAEIAERIRAGEPYALAGARHG